uniref:C2H2-type domain-containing protein n=1 Tax=Neogobius melanostomus TaxID=47308 RepID=A0A8C6TXI1_9GOBI
MSKRSQTLRALVTERLTAAAEEIFELVERTIAEYEEELCRSKEENQRRQGVTDAQVQTATAQKVSAPGLETARSVEVKVEPVEPEHRADTQGDGPAAKRLEMPERNFLAQRMETESDGGLDSPRADSDMSLGDNERSSRNDRGGKKLIPLKRNLRRHRRVPGGDKTFSYSLCTNGFMQRAYVRMYLQARPGETSFCCPVCARQFKLEDQLKRHMSTHTAQNGFSLTQENTARSHEETSDRPFSCSECNARFRRRVNLNRHLTVHCEK